MKHRTITKMIVAIMLTLGSIGIAGAQDSDFPTTIVLNGDSITVQGEGATADGTTLSITQAGMYALSGTLTDGHIIVDASDAGLVSILLNGIELSGDSPFYISNAESAFISLVDGTQSSITDNAETADIDAAIFSNVDLTIGGSGSLAVTTNADHGIASQTALSFTETPTITVNAVGDALKASESVAIEDGNIRLEAGDEGIQSDQDFVMNGGNLVITSVDKGVASAYNLEINGGVINILNSEEGLEGGYITINDGTIDIVANDDGINVSIPDDDTSAEAASGRNFNAEINPYYLHINGGNIVVNAEGDGLDSNASIEMTGGTVIVNGPTQSGNGALDYDGVFNITGGTLIAVGSASMPQPPSITSTQNSAFINFNAPLPADSLVHIQNSDGETLLTFAAAKGFQSIVFSAPELATGVTYDVYTGGSSDGTAIDGVYIDGTYTPGTLEANFTVSSVITQIGEVRRMR